MKAGKVQFHELPSLPNTQLASSQWVILLQAGGHQGVGPNPGWVWINLATSQTEERCEGREGLAHEPYPYLMRRKLAHHGSSSPGWRAPRGWSGNPGWDGSTLLSTSQVDQLTPDFQTWNFKVIQIIIKSVHVARGFMKVPLMIDLSPTG